MNARRLVTRSRPRTMAGVFVGLFSVLGTRSGAIAAPPTEQGGLGLIDGKFWVESTEAEEHAAELFLQSDFTGLFLDGPKRVRFRQHEDLPLIGVRSASNQESFAISLHRRAVLISTWLEGDETYAAMAFRQPDEPSKSPPPRHPDAVPVGHGADAFRIVLNRWIPELVSRSGTWNTTLLLFDRRSNLVATHVEANPDKDGRKVPGADRVYPAKISPPIDAAHHSCGAEPDCPPLPKQSAIVLASAGPVGQGSRRSWIVRGSYLLPASPRDVVRPLPGPTGSAAERKARAAGWQDVGAPLAVAVLPVSLVLTGDKDATPIVVSLHVPAYQALEKLKGQLLARGHFSIDLLALLRNQVQPQIYAVWAVSRERISEPIVVQITIPVTRP